MTRTLPALSSVTPSIRRFAPLAALIALVLCPTAAHAQLRVIANQSYPDADISLRDLTRLYRGEYGSLTTGQRVVLAEQASARSRYTKVVTAMDDDAFRRHWIRLVFAGTPVQPPRSFPDAESVCAFVQRTPGAVAIIDGRCEDGVRTLTVGGKSAGDAQYPLR